MLLCKSMYNNYNNYEHFVQSKTIYFVGQFAFLDMHNSNKLHAGWKSLYSSYDILLHKGGNAAS